MSGGSLAVASFSLATEKSWKDKDDAWQKKTEWHNIKAWRKLAETAGETVKKGSKVFVEGSLETESWEKDGQKHSKTVIVATDMHVLASEQHAEPVSVADADDGFSF